MSSDLMHLLVLLTMIARTSSYHKDEKNWVSSTTHGSHAQTSTRAKVNELNLARDRDQYVISNLRKLTIQVLASTTNCLCVCITGR